MLYVVLGTMLMYLIHLALPKILTYKNHRDFSPIEVRLAKDSNIPDYVSRMHSATRNPFFLPRPNTSCFTTLLWGHSQTT